MKFVINLALAATVFNLLAPGPTARAAENNDNCLVAHESALELILDDEAIFGDLNDESRSLMVQWTTQKLAEYAEDCRSPGAMSLYGLRVRDGAKAITAAAMSGDPQSLKAVYRARLITLKQLRALQHVVSPGCSPDENIAGIISVLVR